MHGQWLKAEAVDAGFNVFHDAARCLFVFTDRYRTAGRGQFEYGKTNRHFLARYGLNLG